MSEVRADPFMFMEGRLNNLQLAAATGCSYTSVPCKSAFVVSLQPCRQ